MVSAVQHGNRNLRARAVSRHSLTAIHPSKAQAPSSSWRKLAARGWGHSVSRHQNNICEKSLRARSNLFAEVSERQAQSLFQPHLWFPLQHALGFGYVRAALLGVVLRKRPKLDGDLGFR